MDQASWAAWGPTIVSIITCIFFAGVVWNRLSNSDKRHDSHDEKFSKLETERDEDRRTMNATNERVGKLEAFRDGYATARGIYDRAGRLERATDLASGD